MTVLILAEQCDEGAAATASAAAARVGTGRVLVVRPVELAMASWTHRISPSGAADTTVRLRDGRRLDSDGVSAVLVRMDLAPLPRFAGARRRTATTRHRSSSRCSWAGSTASAAVW